MALYSDDRESGTGADVDADIDTDQETSTVARSTKQEALATRNRLLDAAEVLLQAQGVSQTSLQQIAQQAGATRGAIYWHFKPPARPPARRRAIRSARSCTGWSPPSS